MIFTLFEEGTSRPSFSSYLLGFLFLGGIQHLMKTCKILKSKLCWRIPLQSTKAFLAVKTSIFAPHFRNYALEVQNDV